MYASLHSIVKKLIADKKSGSLRLRHDDDQRAIIILQEGRIVGFKQKELHGADAGKALSLWITFQSEFLENVVLDIDHHKGFNTDRYLSFLERTAEIAQNLTKRVPLNDDAVFLFIADSLQGEKKFNMDELNVALALDGKTQTRQVVANLAVPDLQVLSYINGFLRNGLVRKITASEPLNEGQRSAFMDSLTEAVAEFVGPAAETIIEDAFSHLESEPTIIYQSELAQLMEAISNYMEEEDRLAFKKWAVGYLKHI